MLENTTTKTWRFLKRAGARDNIAGRLFEPLIGFLAKRERMFLFPHENWGTKMRYLLRWYEPESTKACKKFLRQEMNVLDIGADVGYYTRLFSELVGPKGKVWAFEPYPESFDLLKKNIQLPRYQNVIPIKKAVSDCSGRVKFFATVNPGKHIFYDAAGVNSDSTPKDDLMVETTTVDDFLSEKGNPRIDFIKMDIEGAEPRALAGMKNTVARSKNLAMLVEFNVKALQLTGENPPLFLEQLEGMGFKVQAIQPDGSTRPIGNSLERLDKGGYLNLFCFKS